MSARATAAAIFALGFVVALAGDATHVASGTTRYEWDGVPEIWRSAVWFPFLVAGGVLGAAWVGQRLDVDPGRDRGEALLAAAGVLALYGLTSILRGEDETVSLVLAWAVAVGLWAWWDPRPVSLAIGAVAAVLGPLAEVLVVEAGAASYASDTDGLWGVAPWLTALYFAAGVIASGLWAALQRRR